MSERKVLNKYYPPDFDPTKLPKLKRGRNRQFVIRIMAPFSMRCTTCGEYIYKGRKFNSRMETVENETYLGLRVYRFYIRCTKCISEITFKTDPENADYTMEQGATRNFEAVRRLGQMLEMEKEERAEEEANNPMKALENRTKDSKREMESLEKLEELKDLNQRIAGIDPEKMIQEHLREEERLLKDQEEEDEKYIKQLFSGGGADGYVKRIIDDSSDEEGAAGKPSVSRTITSNPTDILTEDTHEVNFEINMAGPSHKPVLKTKLKTPLEDLSTMIRRKKRKVEDKKSQKVESTDGKIDTGSSATGQQLEAEVAMLPAFKINLKKPEKNNSKIKGASLNLLGGYGSGTSEDSD